MCDSSWVSPTGLRVKSSHQTRRANVLVRNWVKQDASLGSIHYAGAVHYRGIMGRFCALINNEQREGPSRPGALLHMLNILVATKSELPG